MSLNGRSGTVDPLEEEFDEPWAPYASREDFDFAELAHDARLNQKQIGRLIEIIRRCQSSPGSFTLRNYEDLRNVMDRSSKLLTNVASSCFPSRINN